MVDGTGSSTREESGDYLLAQAAAVHDRALGDPSGSMLEAEALVLEARSTGKQEVLAASLRALAQAHHYLLRHERALSLLNEAVRVARHSGLTTGLGEALLSRGTIEHELGRTRSASRDFERAAELLGHDRAAEVRLQQATLLHNAGRLNEAATMYAEILTLQPLDAAARTRAANNLGWLEATLGNHRSAARWLSEAASAADQVGPAYVAVVAESQAWAAVRAGRVIEGIARFDEAVRLWQQADLPLGELYTDYADALINLRLLPEAREQTERAARMLWAHGVDLMAAEAQLRVAALALAMGEELTAESIAEETANSFRRQRRADWRGRATLIAVQARLARVSVTRSDHASVLRVARVLQQSRQHQAAAEAYLVAGKVAAALEAHESAINDWRRAAEVAPRVPVLARLIGHLARALAANMRREDAELLRRCRAGLVDLARHRAALPSTELRALASGHGVELSNLGLGAVLRAESPSRVLAWMERTRAAALSTVEPGPGEGLSDELGALHAIHGEVARARRVDPSALPALLSRRAEIEARIRHASWTGEPEVVGGSTRFSVASLRSALGGRVLIEYDVHDGRIVAAVVDERRTRIVRLGPAAIVDAEIDELRSALHALNVSVPQMASFLHQTAVQLVEHLKELLVAPLELPEGSGTVVVPVGELQRVPWSAMFDRPASVAPSAGLWLQTGRRTRPEAPAVLAAGPGLEWGVKEVEALAHVYGDARVLVPPESRVETVKAALDGASVAHLSCHGEVRADNPTFSSLRLSDGSLTVHELDRRAGAPHRIVLAACDVGGSVAFPGNEVLGFIGTLLTRGTAGVVASTMLVLDQHVTPLMMCLHAGIRSGLTLADALHTARGQVDPTDPRGYPAWCTFTAYGAA
jgi:tetratricopeptide (TPR) repeat protein